jgi:hypothetical protein
MCEALASMPAAKKKSQLLNKFMRFYWPYSWSHRLSLLPLQDFSSSFFTEHTFPISVCQLCAVRCVLWWTRFWILWQSRQGSTIFFIPLESFECYVIYRKQAGRILSNTSTLQDWDGTKVSGLWALIIVMLNSVKGALLCGRANTRSEQRSPHKEEFRRVFTHCFLETQSQDIWWEYMPIISDLI